MRTLIVRQQAGPTRLSRLIAVLAQAMAQHGELSVVLHGSVITQDEKSTIVKEDGSDNFGQYLASTDVLPPALSDSSLWRANLISDPFTGLHSACNLQNSTCEFRGE